MNSAGRRAAAWVRVTRERHTIRFFLAILAGVVAFYSGLFYLLMPWLEGRPVSVWASVYWTINRLTTTGEQPPSLAYTAPALQALSILVQVSGLAFFFAAFPLAILPALERRLSGAPAMLYPNMKDHIVICGYSPVVESLIDELAAGSRPFRVLDNDMELVRELQRKGIPALFGDPTDEEDLALAGVEKARYIIANREDEEDNAKIVLAAAARTDAGIYALIDDLDHAHYFKYAGAAEVFSPKRLLGVYLAEKATAAWRDELFGASELAPDCLIVELPVYPGSPFDGLTLRESRIPERSGASLVGIWHRGKLELEPGPQSRISAENVLVAVARRDQLLELQGLTRTIEVPELTVKRHFVIAGFGDVGRAVREVLESQGIPSTIIEPREKSGEYVRGDATDEDVLRRAKIGAASTLIVASHIDRDNIFTTLVARKLNPDLHILARANTAESTDKLYRAGADFVFSLSTVAAQMLAEMLIGETVTTLAEGLKVLKVPVGGRLAGKTIGRARVRSRTGCTAVAVIAPDGSLTTNPKTDYKLTAGATIVVLGYSAQVAVFKRRFG